MDPAVIGAGAVVVGVLITNGGQLLTDGRKARREQKAEKTREKRELRLAVRLVMEELSEAASLIENAAVSRRYWPAPRQLPTATWTEYRTGIAIAIESPLDWRFITSAYDAVNDLNWLVQHRRGITTSDNDHQLGVRLDALDETREKRRSIRQGIGALEQTVEVQGPASRMMREQDDAELEYWQFGDGDRFDLESALEADMWEHERQMRREQGY